MLIPRTWQRLWAGTWMMTHVYTASWHVSDISAAFAFICMRKACSLQVFVWLCDILYAVCSQFIRSWMCYAWDYLRKDCFSQSSIHLPIFWRRSRASPGKPSLPHGNFSRIFVVWTKRPCPGALLMPSYLTQRVTAHEMQAIRANYTD